MRGVERILELRYAVRLAWQSAPRWCVASCVLMPIQGLLPLAALYVLKLIVDAVMAATQGEPIEQVVLYIAAAALIALFEAACRSLAVLIAENQSQALADYMQEHIQTRSARMDVAFYETPAFQDTLHRAQTDAATRPLRIVQALTRLGVDTISLIGVGILLLAFHWGVTLVLLAGMLPGVFWRVRVSHRLFNWKNLNAENERKAFYLHWLLTSGAFCRECRSFGFGPVLTQRFKAIRGSLRRERLALLRHQTWAEFGAQTGGILVVCGCLLFMAVRTVKGVMTIGSLVMFSQALRRAESLFRDALQACANLYEDSLFLKNLRDFMQMTPQIVSPHAPQPIPAADDGGLRFKHVSFCYPGTGKPVLRDVSVELPPGSRIALLGHNGSGKSTLIDLLCRFYDPDAGTIEYGGVDIRNLDLDAYRQRLGIMFQNFSRYHFTVRENIWLGRVALPPQDPLIEAAGQQAGADTFLRNLTHGYDTQLGRGFKDGAELSQGEWQRIALARAFVSCADLLVLDEPSSFLDPAAEEELVAHLDNRPAGQAVLFVSHRFSTVRRADWIYVLHEGRVAEEGDHETLLRHGGIYARMFALQARAYRA